jgi:pyrroloquinoline quinone biosynthesis protein D
LDNAVPALASFVRIQPDRLTGLPVLLAPEVALELSESGAEILRLCDGRRTLGDIASHLATEFDAPVEEILADAREFLRLLSEQGYVRWAEPCP